MNLHLPAAPLLAYIAAAPNGLHTFFAHVEEVKPTGRNAESGDWTREDAEGMTYVRLADDAVLPFRRVEAALSRGRKAGSLTLKAVDQICCEVLKVHPFEVYGEAYFQIPTIEEAAA